MIKFSNGINIDTDGPYRILCLHDGLYVVGHGMLIPVDSVQEANEIINDLH